MRGENDTCFRDGIRRIDMILAFTEDSADTENFEFRMNYERNLIKDGLELEMEDKEVRQYLLPIIV